MKYLILYFQIGFFFSLITTFGFMYLMTPADRFIYGKLIWIAIFILFMMSWPFSMFQLYGLYLDKKEFDKRMNRAKVALDEKPKD